MQLTIDGDEFMLEIYQKYKDGATDEEISKWWSSLQPPELDDRDKFFPDEEQVKRLREDFEIAIEGDREGKALRVQEYFKLNPHLPQPSLGRIHKFMWAAKNNEEKCKKMFNLYYNLRGTDDELFGNRDPTGPTAMKMYQVNHFACLPQFTKELYRVNISSMVDPDPEKFDTREWVRSVFYIADIRVRHDFCLGDIMIYDLKKFTMAHLLKYPLPLVRKMVIAAEGALPTRIKQIHLVNCPPFVDKITSLFKPFLKEKMANRIFVHMDNLENLYKYVPRDRLPEELGGTLGPMSVFQERWIEELERNKEWFIREEKNIKRIYMEGRKNGKIFVDSGELFGMEGSFKKLDID